MGSNRTILFLYFLLLSRDTFLRRFVEILSHFSAKRQAVDISLQIENDISSYQELNFAPIIGPVLGIALFLFAGLLTTEGTRLVDSRNFSDRTRGNRSRARCVLDLSGGS